MHYRIHVTKNNKLFCYVTRPSKPSRYINYDLSYSESLKDLKLPTLEERRELLYRFFLQKLEQNF